MWTRRYTKLNENSFLRKKTQFCLLPIYLYGCGQWLRKGFPKLIANVMKKFIFLLFAFCFSFFVCRTTRGYLLISADSTDRLSRLQAFHNFFAWYKQRNMFSTVWNKLPTKINPLHNKITNCYYIKFTSSKVCTGKDFCLISS